MATEILKVNYQDPQQASDLRKMLNQYALDPMGGGQPIPEETLERLPNCLDQFGTAFSLLAYVDQQPAGLANCFFGFSTFAARKLVNIHDLVVDSEFRGQGIGKKLLEEVEAIAKQQDCCKITLEVLDKNEIAMNAYRSFGFDGYELDPETGRALFWQKKL